MQKIELARIYAEKYNEQADPQGTKDDPIATPEMVMKAYTKKQLIWGIE